ncbi:hypothetical protein D3C80_1784180 [compost metagenome]
MIDSVDLQVNLTVSREKGKIFGISGKTYKINQVLIHPIFEKLDSAKDLARKATVVLLCHASNHFAIPIACDTCTSETSSTIAQLLRNCVTSCKSENINVQLTTVCESNISECRAWSPCSKTNFLGGNALY